MVPAAAKRSEPGGERSARAAGRGSRDGVPDRELAERRCAEGSPLSTSCGSCRRLMRA